MEQTGWVSPRDLFKLCGLDLIISGIGIHTMHQKGISRIDSVFLSTLYMGSKRENRGYTVLLFLHTSDVKFECA